MWSEERLLWMVRTQRGQSRGTGLGLPMQPKKLEAQDELGGAFSWEKELSQGAKVGRSGVEGAGVPGRVWKTRLRTIGLRGFLRP